MTDDKKEFCYPRLTEDIRIGFMLLGGITISLILAYLFIYCLPIKLGEYVKTYDDVDTCLKFGDSLPCGILDYWIYGAFVELVILLIIWGILRIINWAFKRYWIKKEECDEL